MPQRPYDRGGRLTLTGGGAVTTDVAPLHKPSLFVEHERANTSRVANTPYTPRFVAWFTFASMVIAFIFRRRREAETWPECPATTVLRPAMPRQSPRRRTSRARAWVDRCHPPRS